MGVALLNLIAMKYVDYNFNHGFLTLYRNLPFWQISENKFGKRSKDIWS